MAETLLDRLNIARVHVDGDTDESQQHDGQHRRGYESERDGECADKQVKPHEIHQNKRQRATGMEISRKKRGIGDWFMG